MVDNKFFNSVVKWIVANCGYSFLTAPSNELIYYKDEHGVKRAMTYHGAPNDVTFMDAVKKYVNWRITQVENYPEVTFSKDFKRFKINLIESSYERV